MSSSGEFLFYPSSRDARCFLNKWKVAVLLKWNFISPSQLLSGHGLSILPIGVSILALSHIFQVLNLLPLRDCQF